jgi:hypothetical protein
VSALINYATHLSVFIVYLAGALNPEGHYSYKHSLCREPKYAHELTLAISKLADSTENAVDALCQLHQFISYRGIFESTEARDAARHMTPGLSILLYIKRFTKAP